MTGRIPFSEMPAPKQAGILCNDPRFQTFAALRCGFPGGQFSASAAAEYLRTVCRIASRTALTTDTAARARFQALHTDFDAWTGRIAAPRD
ncbi:hypothetical protein [Puniceibacterium sp. IMCC21224]|uniref:hypothetical protein n=1 Tax=Puniceibacterium sp. IMCC21224 TaxID=1618204 RepID=UPI00065D9458|nr:hypothetical protein [Puniceibacterium sp. IMCC21224]KMK63799.1 hypothetical protein IMCC21224_1934 [Puniceibacterium sp. IMCC21224]